MLSGIFPFGGSELGFVSKSRLTRVQSTTPYNSEARGIDGAAIYRGRERASFSCVLIQYDTTLLNFLWASNTTSPNGFAGANILSLPQPGRNLSPGRVAQGQPLLVAADDPSMPSLLIFAPQYILDAKLDLDRVLNKPYETGFVVACGLDANGYDVREDLMENLSLV
jgi:hypothetical protein